MHLVNILRIITFSFLVGHSILTISDFNSFRVFWDTLYSITDYSVALSSQDLGKQSIFNGANANFVGPLMTQPPRVG